MKFVLVSLLSLASISVFAQIKPENALKYVPGGTIIETKKDEVKVRSPQGGIVEIEFERNGDLDEASGDVIESDTFVPGNGYLSLDKIATSVKEDGFQLKGDWSYDKSFMKDWRYEVDAFKNNQEYEVIVDAKSGKIIDRRLDD